MALSLQLDSKTRGEDSRYIQRLCSTYHSKALSRKTFSLKFVISIQKGVTR